MEYKISDILGRQWVTRQMPDTKFQKPKFQNITKLFYGTQNFRIFWGAWVTQQMPKRKLTNQIFKQIRTQKYICCSAINTIMDKCNALSYNNIDLTRWKTKEKQNPNFYMYTFNKQSTAANLHSHCGKHTVL